MKKIFTTLLTCAALLSGLSSASVEASNLDTYRNLLAKGTLTLKYENITPLPRATNKDKMNFYGRDGMALEKASFLTNRQLDGIVVINGNDKYEEVAYGGHSMCSLSKGELVYYFTKVVTNKNKAEYYGTMGKKNQVAATDRNMQITFMSGESYADPVMTRLLSAILPASQKGADMPDYQYVGSGWLDNGLNYEDYRSNNNGVMEAVRYYFNGYTLVKIAAANYYAREDGKLDGSKFIIKIKEFSPTPDMSYLSLPAGVKDTTKKK